MKKVIQITIIEFFLLTINIFGYSQALNTHQKKIWYVSASSGLQMSGIKNEDFISQNIAPAINIGIGLWFTPEIALQFGYKGPYFNTITDHDHRFYNYYYGEVLLNITHLIMENEQKTWNLLIHPGAGLFENKYYGGRPSICADFGIINKFNKKKISLFVDLSFIMGWDIYQGDEDILPSCTIGIFYQL
jgi:hypothetical protein